jgi:hypothetical protein
MALAMKIKNENCSLFFDEWLKPVLIFTGLLPTLKRVVNVVVEKLKN